MIDAKVGDRVRFQADVTVPEGGEYGQIYVVNYIYEASKGVDLTGGDMTLYLVMQDLLELATEPVAVPTEAPTPKIVPAAETVTTSIVPNPSETEQTPDKYVVSVQFLNDYASTKRYEYYAFGTLDELQNATHVVLTKIDHTDLDSLLEDQTLTVARILDVYPTSRQRWSGPLRYIVDFIDGVEFTKRNERSLRTTQLRKDIKKRLESLTEMRILEEKVKGDPVAEALYQELKDLGDE